MAGDEEGECGVKGVNSFDENGYWSRYSNGKWSVRKIYDDVLGYEYALSGESFDALEVVDKLASLEAENAKLKALIERLVEAGTLIIRTSLFERVDINNLDRWDYIVAEYRASKD